MKSESQIKHCLRECKLNEDHLIDADAPTKHHYLNQGWVECLEWILKPTLTVTPDLQVKVE